MKRFGALFLIPVMLLTLASCSPEGSAVNVTASKVKSDSLISSATYSACLQAVQEVTVVPKVSSTITNVNFKVGDKVNAGDVLFTLDSSDIQNKYNQAKAAYDIAEINLTNTKNGNAASALLKLQQAVDAAQLGLNSSTIARDAAKDNYDKVSYMESIGEASSFELQQAENTMNTTQCALDNATQALEAAQETLRINQNVLIPESIAAAEKQVESAKAALDTAQSALDDTMVTSPIAGVISVLNATAGEIASAQTANATIIDPSAMELVISVTGGDVLKLQNGMSVRVTLNDVLKDYTGTITTISPSADAATGLFKVTIEIDNTAGELRAGMLATAGFDDAGQTPALYIPQQSVQEENGAFYVYKVDGDTAQKTQVTLGTQKNLYVEVTSGLAAEDIVIVDGADKVSENSAINVIKSID
ncbi:Macrolide export protein MacA [bioreactor metagenome]|uniref:Macrolide export protein MacA n=1 Tax=bioreactor metagenome TaxID=1076179 RepID=A0A644WQW4_9ZZZZ